jgi:uncharacterized protein (DUF3820 family)
MPSINQTTSPIKAGPLMPFGKFRGTPIAELSDEYLLWLGCLDDLRQPLLGHVLKEMARRLTERPQADGVRP